MISQASSSPIYGSLWLLLQLIRYCYWVTVSLNALGFPKSKGFFFPVTNSPMGENDFILFTFC